MHQRILLATPLVGKRWLRHSCYANKRLVGGWPGARVGMEGDGTWGEWGLRGSQACPPRPPSIKPGIQSRVLGAPQCGRSTCPPPGGSARAKEPSYGRKYNRGTREQPNLLCNPWPWAGICLHNHTCYFPIKPQALLSP